MAGPGWLSGAQRIQGVCAWGVRRAGDRLEPLFRLPRFLALVILIEAGGSTQLSSLALLSPRRFFHLGIFCASTDYDVDGAVWLFALRAGALTDPAFISVPAHFLYFRLSDVAHPPFPIFGDWSPVILFGLAALAVRILRGSADLQYELIGFAAILAIGIFVYYTGRSQFGCW